MKKIILVIVLGILVGMIIAIPVFIYFNKQKTSLLYVLQVGVYNNYQNALNKQKTISHSVIYEVSNQYLVIAGAAKTKEGIEKMANILDKNNISYYVKEVNVSSSRTLDDYDKLLKTAIEEETITLLNQKILESMDNYALSN